MQNLIARFVMGSDAVGFNGGFNRVNGSSIRAADFAGFEQNQIEQFWDVSFAVEFAGYRHHRFDVFGIAAQIVAVLFSLHKKFVKLHDVVDRGAPDGTRCGQGCGLDGGLCHPSRNCVRGGQDLVEVFHGAGLVGQHHDHGFVGCSWV